MNTHSVSTEPLREHVFGFIKNWSMPVMVLNADLVFVFANDAYLATVEKQRDELIGHYIFDAFPDTPERVQPVMDMFNATLAGEVTQTDETPFEFTDAQGVTTTRYWRLVNEPFRTEGGTITHMVQTCENVTEQVELRQSNDVIAEELDHRVKNMMAVIVATARLSGEGATSVEQYVDDFCGRMDAVSRSYSMLSNDSWRGQDLREVLEMELRAVRQMDSDRITLEGPPVTLSVKSTKDASMQIHEMVTNAMKYGCFSVPTGKLSVKWWLADNRLHIKWSETGLTGVKPPTREGFGTILFTLMPNIEVKREYRDEGLLSEYSVPVSIAVTGVEFGAQV